MSYRNKTYVIFDGDNDMWAYAYMKGWKESEHMEFDFYDAHDLRPLTDRASEETVRARLRQRLSNSRQAIVLIGESTRHLFKFVRWEIETALELDFPIIGVNLNGSRRYDSELCPPILRDQYAVHVPFKAKITKYALDNFPAQHAERDSNALGKPSASSVVSQATFTGMSTLAASSATPITIRCAQTAFGRGIRNTSNSSCRQTHLGHSIMPRTPTDENSGAWIFVSHSHRDLEKVRQIRNELERRGHNPLLFFLKCMEDDDARLPELIRDEIKARECSSFATVHTPRTPDGCSKRLNSSRGWRERSSRRLT